MTLASTPPIKDYIEDGATLNHVVPFQFNAATEIRCTRIPVGGVEGAALTLGADYNVTGGAGGTGAVVKTNAGTNGATFRIRRLSQESQQTKFSSSSSFPAANVEKALDHEMAVVQEIDVARSLLEQRSLRAVAGESIAELPPPAQRASALMQWSGDGKTLLMTGIGALAALLAAPLALLSGAANKGDPGGNVMAIGLFTFAAALSVPAGTDVVRTSGYSVKGVGIADYVNDDATVNAGYVAANPRTSFISANGRGFKIVFDGKLDVRSLGALGDNLADDRAAIQAGLDYLNANGGGILWHPKGVYKVTGYLTGYPNVRVRGSGRRVSRIVSAHAGGGGANPGEDLRNGSVFVTASPVNVSTQVHFALEDIGVENTNGANQGAGYYDTGGTFIELTNVRFVGFKYGTVFDQSELADLDLVDFESQNAGGAGLWVVNGTDLNPLVIAGFSNRITANRCQFNEGAATYGIRDDGGTVHTFADNNYNGCLNHIKAKFVFTLDIRGGEFESAASHCLLIDGPCGTNISGGQYSSQPGNAAIHGQNGPGNLSVIGGTSFSGGGGTNPITGAPNFFGIVLSSYTNNTAVAVKDGTAPGVDVDFFNPAGPSFGGHVSAAAGFNVAGQQVVGARGAAVADAAGGVTVDAEARVAINALLARLRVHGTIAP